MKVLCILLQHSFLQYHGNAKTDIASFVAGVLDNSVQGRESSLEHKTN